MNPLSYDGLLMVIIGALLVEAVVIAGVLIWSVF